MHNKLLLPASTVALLVALCCLSVLGEPTKKDIYKAENNLVFPRASPVSDPCQFKNIGFYSNSYINQCFSSIPFNASVANQTITTLLDAMTLYSYLPILRGPPAPYNNITVDIIAQLNLIAKQSFNSDWDFHKRLVQVFFSLHDAHTLYTPPKPYISFSTYRPYFLGYSTTSSGAILYSLTYTTSLPDDYGIHSSSLSPYRSQDLLGSRLLAINGVEAEQWMNNYSQKLYYSKDFYANLNYVIKSGFTAIQSYQAGTTDLGEYETWTIRTPNGTIGNITFPLAAAWLGDNVNNTQEFLSTYYRSSGQDGIGKRDTLPKRPLAFHEPHPEWMKPYMRPAVTDNQSSNKRQGSTIINSPIYKVLRNVYSDSGLTVSASYGIVYGEIPTAVIRINKFSFNQTGINSEENQFVEMVTFALADSATRNISTLIIDALDNGGGLIETAHFLTTLLIADDIRDPTTYSTPYDAWHSATFNPQLFILADNGFNPDSRYIVFDNWQTHDPYSNDDNSWANGTGASLNAVRGQPQTLANYTQKVGLYNQVWQDYPGVQSGWFDGTSRPYYYSQIVVLTDGTCGSACCQMAMRLQDSGKAKVATWGGKPGEDIETASFCGGNVLDWSDVYAVSYTPINFVTSASVRFNHFESFSRKDLDIPREWKRLSPDFRLYADGVSDGGSVYTISHGESYEIQSSYEDYVRLLVRTTGLFGQFPQNNIAKVPLASPKPPPPSTSPHGSSFATTLSPFWIQPLYSHSW